MTQTSWFLKTLLLIGMTLGFANPVQGKAIVWDLGGTLFKVDALSLVKKIGFRPIVEALVANPVKLYRLFWQVLEEACPDNDDNTVCMPNGKKAPRLYCEVMAGRLTPGQAKKRAFNAIAHLTREGVITSANEVRLLAKGIMLMFDAATTAASMKPIKAHAKLLEKCAQATDSNGEKNKLYILSNMDSELFDHLYNNEKNAGIFKHFDRENIVISAHIGLLKPQKEIFEYVTSTYHLDPEECILVDDQEENIGAAQECGWQTIKITGSSRALARELKAAGCL